MGVKLLGKIKIYDIAKKLNLTSKEVLEMAEKLNIEVKSHMSGVDENEVASELVKFQNLYGLASKVISVLNEVYDKLINQTGV